MPLREAVLRVMQESHPALPFEALPALFVVPGGGGAPVSPDPEKSRVSLRLDRYDLRYALKAVMASAGANFALDQSVDRIVSAWMQDVPVSQGLRALLAAGADEADLTFRFQDGIFLFTPLRSDPARR